MTAAELLAKVDELELRAVAEPERRRDLTALAQTWRHMVAQQLIFDRMVERLLAGEPPRDSSREI